MICTTFLFYSLSALGSLGTPITVFVGGRIWKEYSAFGNIPAEGHESQVREAAAGHSLRPGWLRECPGNDQAFPI